MRISSLCLALPVFAVSIAGYGRHNSEYYSLGCPPSTKPWASQKQQLEAITDYGNLLYLQKQIDTAENTYVATEFINHVSNFRESSLPFGSVLQVAPGIDGIIMIREVSTST